MNGLIVADVLLDYKYFFAREKKKLAKRELPPEKVEAAAICGGTTFRQHRTIASADLSGSFAPFLQFQKREIHTVFPRF